MLETVGPVEKPNGLIAIADYMNSDWNLCGRNCFLNEEHVGFVVLDHQDVLSRPGRRLVKQGA